LPIQKSERNLMKGREMKKRTRITSLALIAFLIVGSGTSIAQRFGKGDMQKRQHNNSQFKHQDQHPRMANLPNFDLSDEQKIELKTFRAENQKVMRYESNLLKEKQAHLRTLLSAPEKDDKAIDNTIDEISSAKGDLLKKKIASHDKMKSFLTDEQVQQLETSRRGKGKVGHMKRGRMAKRKGRSVGTEDNFHGRRFDR